MTDSDAPPSIDPVFINQRMCFTAFGQRFVHTFELHRLHGNDHDTKLYNSHLLTQGVLFYCKQLAIKTLVEALHSPRVGSLFCSTEILEGNEEVFTKARVQNRVILPYEYDRETFLEYSTENFIAYTGKHEQSKTSRVAVIGRIRNIDDKQIILYPMLMGIPSYDPPVYRNDEDVEYALSGPGFGWYGHSQYEIFPEDIQEFSKCKDVMVQRADEWLDHMQRISEDDVKQKMCEILGDIPRKDWGGEQADHFSSVHIQGRQVTAAFLLKGPTMFREMTPEVLGKRADQIYRLAQTSAQLLIVQHSHNIGDAVRATLRAFAVSPYNSRFYCIVDGKNTYRILKAYNKL